MTSSAVFCFQCRVEINDKEGGFNHERLSFHLQILGVRNENLAGTGFQKIKFCPECSQRISKFNTDVYTFQELRNSLRREGNEMIVNFLQHDQQTVNGVFDSAWPVREKIILGIQRRKANALLQNVSEKTKVEPIMENTEEYSGKAEEPKSDPLEIKNQEENTNIDNRQTTNISPAPATSWIVEKYFVSSEQSKEGPRELNKGALERKFPVMSRTSAFPNLDPSSSTAFPFKTVSVQTSTTKKTRKLQANAEYKCKQCPRKFAKEDELKLHNDSHYLETLKKPFVCRFCKSRFSCVSILRRHLKLTPCTN